MILDDLKEQFGATFSRISEKVQDTPAFIQLKERFDGLTPSSQKMVVLAGSVLVFLMILSVPMGWFSESQENVAGFESRRTTLRELLKVSREASDIPDIPTAPPVESLRSDIESRLRQANLIPDQIKSIDMGAESKLIPSERSAGGLSVNVWKLNLRQIVDVGTRLTMISPSVKVTAVEITANREGAGYFDVVYRLVALAVPDLSAPVPEEEPARKGRN